MLLRLLVVVVVVILTYKHPSSYATGLVGQNTSMVLVDGKPHGDGH